MDSTPLSQVLRIVLGILGAIAFLGGLLLASAGGSAAPAAFWPIVIGIGLILVALYEHGRYRAGQASAGSRGGPGQTSARFQPTEELFTDPTSGQLTRVWYDPTSGQREYRPEEQPRR